MKNEVIAELVKNHKFSVKRHPKADFCLQIVFEDGRQYRFQEPEFWETYRVVAGSDNVRAELLKLGCDYLFPENEKSPKIDEEYLRKNKLEAFSFWGILIPELFFSE